MAKPAHSTSLSHVNSGDMVKEVGGGTHAFPHRTIFLFHPLELAEEKVAFNCGILVGV